MRTSLRHLMVTFLLICCLSSSTPALTNEEVFSQFQFNFMTPGARATGLGGAFIGLADDATAVESNPAGLTIITAPEITGEFKHVGYITTQIYENRSFDTPITRDEFSDFVESLPFLSVVYPYKRFVFSLYRQELVNYKSSYRTSPYPIAIPKTSVGFLPIDTSVELTVTNYGIGAAVQLWQGFSFAISPRWAEMKIKSYSARFGYDPIENFITTDEYRTDYSDEGKWASEIDDEGSGFSMNVGILWRLHPKISLGAVYRSGPNFRLTNVYTGNYDPTLSELTLKIPESFGTGLSFRATNFLTFTLDVVYTRYKDLLEDFEILLGPGVYSQNNFVVDNAAEIHLGAEYIVPLAERFVALRAGVYHDPDHTIRFTGTTGDQIMDAAGRELFPGGEDQIHVTGGLGLVVNEHVQIDAAINFARHMKQLSFSAVYRF